MKKYFLFHLFAALLILSAASCQKETFLNEEASDDQYFTGVFNSFSKTTIDGMTPVWSAGDEIYIYDAADPNKHMTIILGTNSTLEAGGFSFHFPHPGGYSSDIVAVYPASAFVKVSGGNPVIRFDTQDGTFAKANICAAKADSDHILRFTNQSAVLRFTSASESIRQIGIPIPEMKNDYAVLISDGNSPHSMGSVSADRSTIVSVGSGAIYIAVPAVKVPEGSSFVYYDEVGAILGSQTVTAEGGNNLGMNKIYNLGKAEANGILPGVFSVSSSSRIQFSKGNLYATSTDGWKTRVFDLYPHQYSINSYNSGASRKSSNTETEVDLFCWSYDTTASISPVYALNISSFNDMGSLIGEGWRTITNDEVLWLLGPIADANPGTDCRTSSTINGTENARWLNCKVGGRAGLLIFPDVFQWPAEEGAPALPKATLINNGLKGFEAEFTLDQFKFLERSGCVFLPAAGDRQTESIFHVGTGCLYWTSTPTGMASRSYSLKMNESQYFPANMLNCQFGCSIRLVRNY